MKAWKHIDLEGGGLQSANLRMLKRMKSRLTAYLLWLLFPLGLHRWYLADAARAAAYPALTLLAVGLTVSPWPATALVPLALLAGYALYDLLWIDRRVVAVNKTIRMQEYLRHGEGAPKGFSGHYTDDGLAEYVKTKEAERGGHPAGAAPTGEPTRRRAPSFAEQEAMLRALHQSKEKTDNNKQK